MDEISTSVEEHDTIIRRIEEGNSAATERAVSANWRNAAARLQRVIEALGDRGVW